MVSERKEIANEYNKELSSIKHFILPIEKEEYSSNYQSYAIYLKEGTPVKRDELLLELQKEMIFAKKGIMTAHREQAYRARETNEIYLPKTDNYSDNSFLLPIYNNMTSSEINYVISSLKNIFN